MPISINLLTEAQAAEQLKRRDPVKFAIYGGLLIIAVMLAWWSYLEVKTMTARGNLAQVQQDISSKTNDYEKVLANEKKIGDAKNRLDSLNTLACARFLTGNLLNALQQTTVDGVQLMGIRVDQNVTRTEATKPVKGPNGKLVPGKPATATTKIVIYLDAKDSSAVPGDQVDKFKTAIAHSSYFRNQLNKTNGVQLINVSPSQTSSDGHPYVLFSIQCTLPEVTR